MDAERGEALDDRDAVLYLVHLIVDLGEDPDEALDRVRFPGEDE